MKTGIKSNVITFNCVIAFITILIAGCSVSVDELKREFLDDRVAELVAAAINGDEASVERLIKDGVNPNEESWDHLTPLHFAQKANSLKGMEILLKNGASPNTINDKYKAESVLAVAVEKQNYAQLDLLFNYGGDVNAKVQTVKTLISIPILYSDYKMMKYLVDRGANISFPVEDPYQYTALVGAANVRDYEMVEYMLEKGTNPLAYNKHGKSFAYVIQSRPSNSEARQRILAKLTALGVQFPLPPRPQVYYNGPNGFPGDLTKEELEKGQQEVDRVLNLYLAILPYYLGLQKTDLELPKPLGERPNGHLYADRIKIKDYDEENKQYYREVELFLEKVDMQKQK
ncbi:ankyrin repeat domain-containing protein [Agarivorans sp. MS3-6]